MKIDKRATLHVVSKLPDEQGHVSEMTGQQVANAIVGSSGDFFDDFDVYTDEDEAVEAGNRLRLMAKIEYRLKHASLTDLIELDSAMADHQIGKIVEFLAKVGV